MGADGERVRYFRDDDVNLSTLVTREKLYGVDDFDSNYAKNIANRSNWKQQDTDTQFDEMQAELWDSSKKKKSRDKQEQHQRQRAVQGK